MNRRGFLTGLVGFLAAPAIVRVTSIMPIKALPNPLYVGEMGIFEGFPALQWYYLAGLGVFHDRATGESHLRDLLDTAPPPDFPQYVHLVGSERGRPA